MKDPLLNLDPPKTEQELVPHHEGSRNTRDVKSKSSQVKSKQVKSPGERTRAVQFSSVQFSSSVRLSVVYAVTELN